MIFEEDSETILAKGLEDNRVLLERIETCNFDGFTPDEFVIEWIVLWSKAGSTTVDTIFWSGQFAHAWGSDIHKVTRNEVLKCTTGRVRGKKDKDVRAAMIARFGPPGTKKAPGKTYKFHDDEWQALGVAVTHKDRRK